MTNSEIDYVISEYIHKEKHRVIMRYRLIDGYTYEKIADQISMSPRQIKNIVYKCKKVIDPHID